jgi:hypothetical protein
MFLTSTYHVKPPCQCMAVFLHYVVIFFFVQTLGLSYLSLQQDVPALVVALCWTCHQEPSQHHRFLGYDFCYFY